MCGERPELFLLRKSLYPQHCVLNDTTILTRWHPSPREVGAWSRLITRMHSSRMRTVRNSSRLLGEGGTCPGGVPAHGGCTCLGVYLVPEDVPAEGCTWSREVYLPGGCTCWGGVVYLAPGGYLPRGAPAQVLPPWTEWLTDRCKNITFATWLRTVIKL